MLSPIPRRILRDTATFSVPTGIDRYQKPQTVNYTVQNVQTQAQQAGGVMTCTVTDRRGGTTGPYTVEIIDGLPDDEAKLHHWELGLA